MPRAVPGQQLGHERDLGAQRAGELGHEAAQELLPDDARGAGGEAGEEVELPERGHARATLTGARTAELYG